MKMTSSAWHTVIGTIGAMIGFMHLDPPDFIPQWFVYLVSVFNIGISFYLGKTHPGKAVKVNQGGNRPL